MPCQSFARIVVRGRLVSKAQYQDGQIVAVLGADVSCFVDLERGEPACQICHGFECMNCAEV